MLRWALPLSVALAVLCGAQIATAARSTTTVAGDVRDVAFTDPGLAVAHQPPRGSLTVERFVAGSPPQPLLGTSLRGADDQVQLAGSAQALAVGLLPDGEDGTAASRVFAGPASGPLREVAGCEAGLLLPPVAVTGARIAWREGGCGDPPARPTATTAAAIVIAAADPAIAPTRVALGPAVLPVSIVLAGAGGLVGLMRPSFFALDSEVRSFGQGGAGATLTAQRGALVLPVGVLADGTRVLSLARLDLEDSDRDDDVCATTLFTIAAGSAQRRELPTGGCLVAADALSDPQAARVAGDRVYALVRNAGRARNAPPLTSLVSMRADGGDRRVHASGSYRQPLGVAADGDRFAFWHARCSDADTDLVVIDGATQDGGPAQIATCRARVLTRVARVRGGRISIRVRCPAGCRGVAVYARGNGSRRFAFAPGTHALRLAVSRRTRRRGRLRLTLAVEGAPGTSAEIRLRR